MATRRQEIGRPAPRLVPSNGVLRHQYQALLVLPNVIGCYVGRKQRDGATTEDFAVTVCVTQKPPSRLLADKDTVPRHIEWRPTSKSRRRLKTDVVEIAPESGREAAVTGPGDGIRAATGGISMRPGSLGAAIDHPSYGNIVTTAAHLFVSETTVDEVVFPLDRLPTVEILNIVGSSPVQRVAGKLLKYVINPLADYALLLPHPDFPARNLYHDRLPITATRELDDADIETVMFAATRTSLRRTTVKGRNATMRVGNSVVENAIVTTRVTQGGDSGCCLVTPSSEACGLLVGFAGPYSVFMPIATLLRHERAVLAQGEFNENTN